MLDDVQIIKDNDRVKFAVIPFEDYLFLKELLSDESKLADYLDYLHIQSVKGQTQNRLSLADVRRELAID